MKKPLVSIIIINWNGKEILTECLSSLLNQTYAPIEILVFDNGSQDGSREMLKKDFKQVILIESENNLGFAEGNNKTLHYAKGEYILLLNNDTVVTKDFLSPLVHALDNVEVGVVQPKILFQGNPVYKDGTINSIGSFFTWTGLLYHFGYGKNSDKKKYTHEMPIFSAHGACMLIKKSLINKIGLFDKDFFAYFEETDFCTRAWLAGKKIVYIPDSIIYHKGSVSSSKFGMERMVFHSFKNKLCSFLKNFDASTLLLLFPFHLLLVELSALVYLLKRKYKLFFLVHKAIWWNLQNLRRTLHKRKLVQKHFRTVPDKSFLPLVTKHPRMSYYYYLFKGLEFYED